MNQHYPVLHPEATTFEKAVAISISHRLSTFAGSDGHGPDICPNTLKDIFVSALSDDNWKEAGHRPSTSLRQDALAYVRRDPACDKLLEPILFYKGYAAVVCHRVAYHKWHHDLQQHKRKSYVALWLQSQASAAFGVDIHPAATIGCGFMMDHATGIVVGETATIGDGCTILHGVTLGGTGKEKGRDRHPKVGKDVLIGAGTQVLGNIMVGDGAKIGAGSVVLRSVPHGTTAVGVPARVVGWAREKRPGSSVDMRLLDVVTAVGGGVGGGSETPINEISTEQEERESKTVSTESLTSLTLSSSTEHVAKTTEEDEDSDDQQAKDKHIHRDKLEHENDDVNEKEVAFTVNANVDTANETTDKLLFVPYEGAGGNEIQKNKRSSRRRSSFDDVSTNTDVSSTKNINANKRRYSVGDESEIDICCPYRDFCVSPTASSSSLSPFSNIKGALFNAVTFPQLQRYLKKEGATNYEIGETFMELLKRDYCATTMTTGSNNNKKECSSDENTPKQRNKCAAMQKKKREGCVTNDVFVNEFVNVAEKYTRIERERLEVVMAEIARL